MVNDIQYKDEKTTSFSLSQCVKGKFGMLSLDC